MASLFCTAAIAQIRTITGKVTDENSKPIPGVTIQVKGTNTGTTTVENGTYSIKVPAKAAKLVFSAVGFASVEQPITAASEINVSLKVSSLDLTEVVVTAYGIKKQAKELGYATAKIDNSSLNQAKVVNPVTALAGKVSGMQVNLLGNGVNPDIRVTLRGNRSITGNNQALVVVDGVPVPQSALTSLNPNDIDNINVLKGANAAALYGSDGVGGVLMVTTKRGRAGKPVIKVSSTTQIESVSMYPKMQHTYGGGSDGIHDPIENTSWGPAFDGSSKQVGPTLADGSKLMLPYVSRNDIRTFWNTGVTMQNDVSLAGGDATSDFFLSFQDVNIKGVTPKDKNRRTGGRLNANKKWGIFSAGANIGYTVSALDIANATNPNSSTGTVNIYDNLLNTPDNVPLKDLSDWQNNKWAAPDGYFNGYYVNPYWAIDNVRRTRKTNLLNGNVELGLKPLSWLNFTYRLGLYNESYNDHAQYAQVKYTKAYQRPTDNNGYVGEFTNTSRRINSDILVTLDHKFGDFSGKLTLGNTIRDNYNNYSSIEATALVVPGVYNVSNRTGEAVVSQSLNNSRLTAQFADLALGYKDFLFLDLTGRRESTSVLAPDNRTYFYPGASASFVFTDAIPSLKAGKVLSFGKLLVSANRTGLVNLGAYSLETPYNVASGFPYGSLPGYSTSSRVNNPNLKPEFVNSYEGGVQLGFFKNRLNVSATYFNSISKGQIIAISTSNASGYSSTYINAGKMTNKGLEFDVNGTIIEKKNFSWSVGVNGTYIKSKVAELTPGVSEVALGGYANSAYIYAILDNPYPILKTTAYLRDDQGRIVVDGTTGYPKQAPALKNMGQTTPDFMLGLNTTIKYKSLTLSAVFDYRTGYVFYNRLGKGLDFNGHSLHSVEYNRQPFVVPNSVIASGNGYVPNTSVKTQSGQFDYWYGVYSKIDENYVGDATFLKLRELSLTWTVPMGLFGKQNVIKGASVGVSGRNLFMWLPKSNEFTDPEFNFSTGNAIGISDATVYPPTRIIGFNISLTF